MKRDLEGRVAIVTGGNGGIGLGLAEALLEQLRKRQEVRIGLSAGDEFHKDIDVTIDAGLVARDEILLCTKGGFIAGDDGPPSAAWFQKTFKGVISPDDIVADCHCMTPAYLNHEIEQSRSNLGVETIDVYYVHNPETQRPEVGEAEYYARLTEAFRCSA